MKAAYITGTGGLDLLTVGELADPAPEAGEVVVRVKAAGLNHLDLWVRRGLPNLKLAFPHVLGGDAAGIVEKTGALVGHVKPGDEVVVYPGLSCLRCERCLGGWESLCREYRILGEHVWGTHAELVKVPGANVFPKPKSLSWKEAGAAPLVFTTAWQMAVHRARITVGETVLVHAAGSGVGMAAIQIARLVGARVIATAGSREKLEEAKRLGADEAISYRDADWAKQVKALAGKNGVDVVLDSVGAAIWEDSLRCLTWGGRFVTCGSTSGHDVRVDLRQVFYRQLQILGSTMGSKRDFPGILALLGEGKLRAVVGKSFRLDDAASAYAYLESRKGFGKVVLEPT